MFGLRSAKSGVLLMVLLPFLFMVVASPFTHTCIETPPLQSASYTVRTSRGHNAEAFTATTVAPSRSNESCAACNWARSSSTLSQPICTLCSATIVVDFIPCRYDPRVVGIFQPHAPRAPPAS